MIEYLCGVVFCRKLTQGCAPKGNRIAIFLTNSFGLNLKFNNKAFN